MMKKRILCYHPKKLERIYDRRKGEKELEYECMWADSGSNWTRVGRDVLIKMGYEIRVQREDLLQTAVG